MKMKMKKECDDLIIELQKFSNKISRLGSSIDDDRLELFENKIKYILPEDFKYIIKRHNGISILGTEVFGIDDKFEQNSLDKIYDFEHYSVPNKMPEYFLPFSADGRGNHYCLDLSRYNNGITPIIFWQWDLQINLLDEIETCNESFIEWIKEVMIDWTLENYDHEGNDR